MKKLLLICYFLFLHVFAHSQTVDSTTVLRVSPHSASRAAKLSAVVPGLGQAYNKQYWKAPIIYLGAGALIYSISWNNQNYQKYLKAYQLDSDTSSATNSEYAGLYSVDNLIVLKDYYRRNRDLSAIGLVLLYAANIIDAYVYGQFYNFDVSDDLSMQVKPFVYPSNLNYHTGQWTATSGISLTLRFK